MTPLTWPGVTFLYILHHAFLGSNMIVNKTTYGVVEVFHCNTRKVINYFICYFFLFQGLENLAELIREEIAQQESDSCS